MPGVRTHLSRFMVVDPLALAAEGLSRIEPGPAGDLDRQESLTHRLLAERPVYGDAPSDWLGAVEDALAVPVLLRSSGPTRSDKRSARLSPAGMAR